MKIAIIGQQDFGSDITPAMRALVSTEVLP
jgi:hypothetical protein